MTLTGEEFDRCFRSFRSSAFRLQLLPEYAVLDESDEYAAYRSGQPLPDDRSKNVWLTTMAEQVARGREWTNIHLLPERLTPYLRYLIDWWYVYQDQAGAKILFLLPELAPQIHTLAPRDFWLFDDERLIEMHYGPGGRFLGAEDGSSEAARANARQARTLALEHALDLRTILARRRTGNLI